MHALLESHDQKETLEDNPSVQKSENGGSHSMRTINALILGAAGVGKTSLKNILLKYPCPVDQSPTVREMSEIRVRSNASNNWEFISEKKLQEQIAQFIDGVTKTPDRVDSDPILQTTTDNIYKEADGLLDSGSSNSFNWIYLKDCGSQPHFQYLLSHFVHGISVVIFTLSLSTKLDECLPFEYYSEGRLISEPNPSCLTLTAEDSIKCLIRCIRSQEDKPYLIFVGTFNDEMNECSETLAEKNEKLCSWLVPEFDDQLVFYDDSLTELIFPLDCKHPDDKEETVAELIRANFETFPTYYNVPRDFYILEIALKQLSSQFRRLILSLDECYSVAHKLGISKNTLIKALKHFHRQHIFHYYSDKLPNIVFTSSQVLLDKLTEIIFQAHFMRIPSVTRDSPSRLPTFGKWRKFRDRGIITAEFLKHKDFQKHYIEGLFTPADLITVFKNHHIILPFSDHARRRSLSQLPQYYMPALLDLLPSAIVETFRNFKSLANPVLLLFTDGWPQIGIFYHLQVYLIQKLRWELKLVLGKANKPKLMAQNCIMLSPPNSTSIITLIDSYAYFEVHIDASPDVCRGVCSSVLSDILGGIEEAQTTLNYEIDEPQIGFFGFCDHMETASPRVECEHHSFKLVHAEGSLKCMFGCSTILRIEEGHEVWLRCASKTDISSSVTTKRLNYILSFCDVSRTDTDKNCSDDHIFKVGYELNEWESVARRLDLSEADIKAIKHDQNAEMMPFNALKRWKSKAMIVSGAATYHELLIALLECGCEEKAFYLCKLLAKQVNSSHRT